MNNKQNRKPWNKGKNKGKVNDVRKQGDYMKNDIKSAQNSVDGDTKPVFNDLRWYVSSEQILKDVARLPYNLPVGLPFSRDPKFYPETEEGVTVIRTATYDHAMPGLMVSSLMPMLGSTSDGSSAAVNIAANALFQFVRSKISGSRTYRPVDMMLYMGAMDSLYCYLTWLTRLYATVFTYHNANRYLSRAIIEAQNVDYDDLVDKLPQFRSAVNIMIAKVRSLYLPSVLPIFLRHSWMFSHYFIEGDNEKDQIYLHMPAGYHYFTKDESGAGALAAVCIDDRRDGAGKLDVAHLIAALSSMIDPIYQDEDFNRIGGDMLKAYEGKVFTLSEIPDIATVKLAQSEEVLLQFKNAKYKDVLRADAFYAWKNGCFNYYQNAASDPNLHVRIPQTAVCCRRSINTEGTGITIVGGDDKAENMMWSEWSKDTLLTSPHADVQPGENMINTRLTLAFPITTIPDATSNVGINVAFGSEWPVNYHIFSYHRKKSNRGVYIFRLTMDRVLVYNSSFPEESRLLCDSIIPIRSAFKFLPELSIVEVYTKENDDQSITSTYFEPARSIFEVDNYAVVSASSIEGMHNAAILGEYSIPELAVGK